MLGKEVPARRIAVILIHYIPPNGAPLEVTSIHAANAPGGSDVAWSLDDETRFERGRPSRLRVGEVGGARRDRLNTQDALRVVRLFDGLEQAGIPGPWQALRAACAPTRDKNALLSARLAVGKLLATARTRGTQKTLAQADALLGAILRRKSPGDPQEIAPVSSGGLWPTSAARLHAQALKLADDRPQEALKRLASAIKKAPLDARIRFDWGRLLMQEGYYEQARAVLHDLAKAHPRKASLFLALGDLEMHSGQPEAAIAPLKRAVFLTPNHAEAYERLGVAFYDIGSHAEAAQAFQRASALAPASEVSCYHLAQIALAQGDVFRAKHQLDLLQTVAPHLDLRRFQDIAPKALAAENQPPVNQHHWQLPGIAQAAKKQAPST
jgi:tetratricopeptide (TPR) repeat protein